jgi:uncharacterized protein YfaS (alpha-2-macroglobulin family)
MKPNVVSLPVLCALVALLATACPGQKPAVAPAKPAEATPKGPLVWKLSKSGLGFRLSNADEDADKESEHKVAPSTPLGAEDARKMAARLPALQAEPDDSKDFAMRDKSLPAPRPGKTVNEPFPPPSQNGAPPAVVASGPLTVERHAPEGPVELAPHLTMTFSQPMVPITTVDDLAKEKERLPVSLVPQPAGKWRWLGTKTLMFAPEKRFPMATEYAVEIPVSTKALNGQALAKPVQWTFTTPPVTMKRSFPASSSEPLDPVLYAELDQEIDPKELIGSLELSSNKGVVPIRLAESDEIEANDNVRRLSQAAEKGRWIAFRPTAKLSAATPFTVRIKAGAPSAEGPRRTTKDQSFSFSTFGPLRVDRSTCAYSDHCGPLQPFYVTFSNPIDLKTFDKKLVTAVPEIPGMKVEVHGQSMTVSGRTKGRTKYAVNVSGAIGDVHGQTMGNDAHLVFDVGSAEPTMFGAESDMVVLDPASPKSYPVYSINEPGLHARVFAVGPEDWDKYVAYTQEWERPRKLSPPGRLVSDKVLAPKKAPDELVSTNVELGPALNAGFGQVLIVVEPTRTPPKGWHRAELDLWLQSTDLGVNAYVEQDQVTGWVTRLADGAPQDGVTLSLLDAGSATTDKDGLARVPFTQKPGKLVVAKKGKDTAIVSEHYYGQRAYMQTTRSDQARWLVFDDRGMYKPGEEVHLKGWLRRAGLSRGGDLDAIPDVNGKTVTFKVRDPRYAEIGTGTTKVDENGGFDLAFKLPGNANLGNARVELTVEGVGLSGTTTSHGFQIQEFRRPEFEVTAKTSEGPHFVGEFATATVNAAYYSGGGLPDAPVSWRVTRSTTSFTPPNRSEFHFGPEPSFYWSWHSKPPSGSEATKTETWTSHTNPQGIHRLRVDFDALEPSYPMSLDMNAEVEDVNRQQWAGRTTMLVHPADYYVGLRLAKSFIRAGENIDLDMLASDVDGKLVAGRAISVKAARIDWEQQGSEYVEKELDPQTCEVTSTAATPSDVVRCSFKTAQGGSYRVTAIVKDDHGRKSQTATQIYVMAADLPKEKSLGGDRVTVVPDKKEYKPGELAEVLVIAPFVPAEGLLTVRRQGIVHVERFTMKTASQAIKLKLEDTLVPNAEIRVDLVGANVRDDATGTPDPKLAKRPAFASSAASVKIVPLGRTLGVNVAAKKLALEPGGSTQIDVDVKNPDGRGAAGAQVAVIVVDEAVLALSGYKTPDPVAVFYSPRGTDVREIMVRDRVLLADPDLAKLRQVSAREDFAPGGGGFGSGQGRLGGAAPPQKAMARSAPSPTSASAAQPVTLEANLDMMEKKASSKETKPGESSVVGDTTTPIQVRSDFSALALFAPRVKTDAQGHATVPIKLPDNLTRYRVMALVASGDRSFGAGESTLTARLPVMARPSAPRFLNFGDKFELPVIVQNQTDAPVEVGVVARATNATIEEPSAKRVKIAANDRVEVRFNAGTMKPGTARFQIGIASGGFSDASQVELPVYTRATTEAFATYGEIDEGAIAQPVKMPPGVFPQFGGLEITTSSTQVQALTDALLYLVKYPFECNEQIASRVIAIAALRDVLQAFKAEGMPSPAALEQSMKTDFEKLKRHQNYNGGWGFWQENPWPYLSIHVAHALVRAKDKGYKPDEDMMRRAQTYLRNVESYIPSWYGEDARRSLIGYALFVRKKMNDADPARAKRLMNEAGGVDKLPIEAVGWIWPTISGDAASTAENDAIRRHVANRVTETAGNAHFVSGYKDSDWVLLHSDRRADGVLLESMIGDQKDNTVIPKLVKGLLAHRKEGRWHNTNENAFVLLALDRYFNTYEKVTPDFVARIWLGDRFAGQHQFKGRTTEYSDVKIPMQWLAGEASLKGGKQQDLVIGKDGPGRLYYRVGMQYAPTDLKLPPTDQGFVVSRTYEGAEQASDVKRDPDGTWRVKAGSKVRVRVSMVAQSRRYHVALVDPIPAGLEALNPALAVTGEIPKDPKAEAAQAKSGRYWYWNRTWYEHQNMRDERVEAFASLLYDGVWDYTYVAKATTPGVFVVPPPKAEEMYSPETFGRGAGDRMIVE